MYLYDRRDGQNPPDNVIEKYKRAQDFMQKLVDGATVFGDLENQAAGSSKQYFFTEGDLLNNDLVSVIYNRSFGHRTNQRQSNIRTF